MVPFQINWNLFSLKWQKSLLLDTENCSFSHDVAEGEVKKNTSVCRAKFYFTTSDL